MSFINNMQEHNLSLLQTLDGRMITYTPSGGIARNISGMLQEFSEAINNGSVDIMSTDPVLSVRSIDVPEVANDDIISIETINYKIVNIRPDNEGMIEIVLEKL